MVYSKISFHPWLPTYLFYERIYSIQLVETLICFLQASSLKKKLRISTVDPKRQPSAVIG